MIISLAYMYSTMQQAKLTNFELVFSITVLAIQLSHTAGQVAVVTQIVSFIVSKQYF